eukprot:CAMPEP_0196591150 /NCGR_PEP_ID=MMETSP1081-20130531/68682_1 /TAXON_ID=36882 /ORGANISM="Pyramimonas amylifera, Strain CCMP720" /LENGTH=96 /DNA_ID=CAMNT_0041914433 /DNA_START=235 /DNA_END=522 /DNA_ORIENTATION=-
MKSEFFLGASGEETMRDFPCLDSGFGSIPEKIAATGLEEKNATTALRINEMTSAPQMMKKLLVADKNLRMAYDFSELDFPLQQSQNILTCCKGLPP